MSHFIGDSFLSLIFNKGVYTLASKVGNPIITYTINERNGYTVDDGKEILVSTINPGTSKIITFPSVGVYSMSNTLNASVFLVDYNQPLKEVIVPDTVKALTDTSYCCGCTNAEMPITKDMVASMVVINTVNAAKELTYSLHGLTLDRLIYDENKIPLFLEEAFLRYRYLTLPLLTDEFLNTITKGYTTININLHLINLSIYYLAWYFWEVEQMTSLALPGTDGQEYIDTLYQWDVTSKAITKLGVDITQLKTLYNAIITD